MGSLHGFRQANGEHPALIIGAGCSPFAERSQDCSLFAVLLVFAVRLAFVERYGERSIESGLSTPTGADGTR